MSTAGSAEWRAKVIEGRARAYAKNHAPAVGVAGELAEFLATGPMRDGRPLSRRQLALEAGVSPTLLHELLHGQRQWIGKVQRDRILTTLDRLGWYDDLDAVS